MTRWQQFLNERIGDQEKILQVQQFFGVCLDPEARAGKALILTGPGATGKSVMLSILVELVGAGKVGHVDFLGGRFALSGIVGKRLVIGENPLMVPTVKAVIAGEKVAIDRQYKEQVLYTPECNLVFETNLPARFFGGNHARRLLVVPFHRPLDAPRDLRLVDTLLGELEEIRAWSREGFKSWLGHFES